MSCIDVLASLFFKLIPPKGDNHEYVVEFCILHYSPLSIVAGPDSLTPVRPELQVAVISV